MFQFHIDFIFHKKLRIIHINELDCGVHVFYTLFYIISLF